MVISAFSTVLDSGRRPQHSATKNHDPTIRACRERRIAVLLDPESRIYIYIVRAGMDGVAAMGVAICPCQL